MLTKHQEKDLEKAILGYLVSRKYFQSVSAFAQESPNLKSADFISLEEPPEPAPGPSQINLIFNVSKDDSDFALSKNSTLSGLSVGDPPLCPAPRRRPQRAPLKRIRG